MRTTAEGSRGYRLDAEAITDLDGRLRSVGIKRIEVVAEALVDPKIVRNILTGKSATLRSMRAVGSAIRRLLRGTEAELPPQWLERALILEGQKHTPGPRFEPTPRGKHPRIDLDLWLHRTGLNPDRFDERIRFNSLNSLLASTDDEVLLLLAGPGAGKSTLLREHAAQTGLTLYAKVESYAGGSPLTWLAATWQAATGQSGSTFRNQLRAGKLVLLLDGLSEGRTIDGKPPAAVWSRIIGSQILCHTGNRVIVSCRQLEYNLPLRIGDTKLPVVRMSGVQPQQATSYLSEVLGKKANRLISVVKEQPALLSLCSIPMFLSILANAYAGGELPATRSDLFRMLLWRLMREEHARHRDLLVPPLVSNLDQLKLSRPESEGIENEGLPNDGDFIEGLQKLAWYLQANTERRLRLPIEEARQILGESSNKIISAGCALSLLTLDLGKSEVGFEHHLWQEFFVALSVAKEGAQGYVESRWCPAAIASDRIAGTGWEEVALFTGGLSSTPLQFLGKVERTNLALAARIAEDMGSQLPVSIRREIQQQLAKRLRDPAYTQEERLVAGREIRELSVIGYEHVGKAWVPPLATIPEGTYSLGTPTTETLPVQHHAPGIMIGSRQVKIAKFQAAVYPVTNAEFGAFIADGGYENESWWQTPEAKAWRDGKSNGAGMRWQLRQNRRMHREWGKDYICRHIGIRWTQREASEMLTRLQMTDEEFEVWVEAIYPDGQAARSPMYWLDPELNAPSHPVVGLSWYEATAYCSWLTHVVGREFRLLSDVELEAAARGFEGRIYAFGDFYTPEVANLHPSGFGCPTPVGMFAPTPEGVYDLTGNVWMWTGSPDDSDGDRRMMTCGGSYDTSLPLAAAYCRDSNHPGYLDRYVGFRLGAS